MDDLRKKVSYLQGMMDGLNLKDSKEGRILNEVLKVLEGITDSLAELKVGQAELENYLESVDDDLFDLEDEVYDGFMDDEDDLDEEEADYVEVECPECHDLVMFDASILEDEDVIEVTCPNCSAVVFVNDDDYEVAFDEELEPAARTDTTDI